MTFEIVTAGELETNGYIVREGDITVVIDPGAEPDRFVKLVCSLGTDPSAILLTHGHGDHIGAVGVLRHVWPKAEIVIHPHDAPMLRNSSLNLAVHMGVELDVGEPTRMIEDGEVLHYGPLQLEVRHIPGHTRGHVVFVHDPSRAEGSPAGKGVVDVFVGDTLFAGGIGRWDFPGGDGRQLIQGIRDKLLTLPAETRIHPGHGPSTTIGAERRTNPYLRPDMLRMMGFDF